MVQIKQILLDSFEMMFDRPQLFVPKVVVTLLSSLFIVLFVDRFVEIYRALTVGEFVLLTLLAIFLMGFTGLYSALMVVSMVKNDWKEKILLRSFYDVFEESSKMVAFTIGFMFFSLVLGLAVALGFQTSLATGNLLYFILTSIFSIILILGLIFAVYFLPITMLEDRSALDSLRASFKTSRENSLEVSVLVAISVLLLVMAIVSSGALEKLGYLGFIIGRMISTVLNTYLFVVSPKYYMEIEA